MVADWLDGTLIGVQLVSRLLCKPAGSIAFDLVSVDLIVVRITVHSIAADLAAHLTNLTAHYLAEQISRRLSVADLINSAAPANGLIEQIEIVLIRIVMILRPLVTKKLRIAYLITDLVTDLIANFVADLVDVQNRSVRQVHAVLVVFADYSHIGLLDDRRSIRLLMV